MMRPSPERPIAVLPTRYRRRANARSTLWRFAMRNSIPVRWIEQTETRSLREHAALQRAAFEPHVSIEYAGTGSFRFDRLRELARRLGRTVTTVSLLDKTVPLRTRTVAAFKKSYAGGG